MFRLALIILLISVVAVAHNPQLDKLITKSAHTRRTKLSSPPPPKETLARYAFNFFQEISSNSTTTAAPPTPTQTNSTMAATAVVDMMSQIRDPFKHGVTAAVLAGLYILALISLIVFASTGTMAFICSFVDCRNFFLGMKPEGMMPRNKITQHLDFLDNGPDLEPFMEKLDAPFNKFSALFLHH